MTLTHSLGDKLKPVVEEPNRGRKNPKSGIDYPDRPLTTAAEEHEHSEVYSNDLPGFVDLPGLDLIAQNYGQHGDKNDEEVGTASQNNQNQHNHVETLMNNENLSTTNGNNGSTQKSDEKSTLSIYENADRVVSAFARASEKIANEGITLNLGFVRKEALGASAIGGGFGIIVGGGIGGGAVALFAPTPATTDILTGVAVGAGIGGALGAVTGFVAGNREPKVKTETAKK